MLATDGGADPGAVDGGLKEKDITLQLVGQVMRLCQGQGIDVVMTRTADIFVTLKNRAVIERNAVKAFPGKACFLSIHVNAGPPGTKARGSSVFYHETSVNGKILAVDVLAKLRSRTEVMPQYNGGVLADEGDGNPDDESFLDHPLYVLKYTQSPAALIELGFITSEEDRALLSNWKFKQAAALGIAEGLMAWFLRT
jgi:N-acetylmuramoyl-L-alanine amidase